MRVKRRMRIFRIWFGELPERTRPSIFDGQPPLTEEDKRGYSKEQWAEIIAENKGGSDGVEAGRRGRRRSTNC